MRSTSDIAAAAHAAFQWSTLLPKNSVFVEVASGWVTPMGELEWEYQRQSIADAVRFLSGVLGGGNSGHRGRTDTTCKGSGQLIFVDVSGHDVFLTG
jgi:hypothetical protein